MKLKYLFGVLILSFATIVYTKYTKLQAEPHQTHEITIMNNYLSLFEIPATDLPRAVKFYETILGLSIEVLEMPGMEMGILPYKNQAVNAVIIKAEGYTPSANGVTIYLNAGNNLQTILDKVEEAGGQVLVPKTAHADESGFFALFLDSEGNRLGLNSPH
jgi:predicted enzyme related to lactoylglutathione lyase